jgi:RHS repeat-associated protein
LGAYQDKETNLHYNYFRHYDPSIGRYGESDPIGLRGGLNTYAYVYGSPLSLVDLLGLAGADGLDGSGRRGGGYFPGPLDVFIPGTPANQALGKSVSQIAKAIKNFCSSAEADYDKCVRDCRATAEFENERCYQRHKNDPPGYEECAAGVLARMELCIIDCGVKHGF